MRPAYLILTTLLSCTAIFGGPVEDAEKLKEEALEILKANTAKQASPEEYASCILKLERAAGILETSGNTDNKLAQEVNTTLFWARRFSNVQVVAAMDKLRGQGGEPVPTVPKKTAVATPTKSGGANNESPEVLKMRAASEAFTLAEKFAKDHSKDPYIVALRWFQMAGEHAGTDYALKALELAREAQKKFLGSKAAEPEAVVDGDDAKIVNEADALVKAKKFPEAFNIYKAAIKLNDHIVLHRKYARALFECAQQMNDDLKPRFDSHLAGYSKAYQGAWRSTSFGKVFNPDDPGLKNWQHQLDGLKKEKDAAMKNYEQAEYELKAVLRLAPANKDFEAAGYLGLSQSVRPFFKMTGLQTLQNFVKDYTPENDIQRTLYEFCKTEIERLRRG